MGSYFHSLEFEKDTQNIRADALILILYTPHPESQRYSIRWDEHLMVGVGRVALGLLLKLTSVMGPEQS